MKVKVSVWRRQLANAIPRHCNCQTSCQSSKGMGGQRITMYGHRTDIEALQFGFHAGHNVSLRVGVGSSG